jgi:hypothetical protein
MPEFNFKRNSAAAAATATASATVRPTEKAEKKSDGGNFSRNVGKYATMPTKRSCEPINCDTGHHSDGEHEEEEDLPSDDEDQVIAALNRSFCGVFFFSHRPPKDVFDPVYILLGTRVTKFWQNWAVCETHCPKVFQKGQTFDTHLRFEQIFKNF